MSAQEETRPGEGRAPESLGGDFLIQATTTPCEACDKLPEPCECIECDYEDPWEIPEGELCACRCDHGAGQKCRCRKCDHLGRLYTFRRDVFAHRGCVPAGWRPEREAT